MIAITTLLSAVPKPVNVVMSHADKWYDVRSLIGRELDEFVADLLRAEAADLQAGCLTPH